jgi:hypothetical protein
MSTMKKYIDMRETYPNVVPTKIVNTSWHKIYSITKGDLVDYVCTKNSVLRGVKNSLYGYLRREKKNSLAIKYGDPTGADVRAVAYAYGRLDASAKRYIINKHKSIMTNKHDVKTIREPIAQAGSTNGEKKVIVSKNTPYVRANTHIATKAKTTTKSKKKPNNPKETDAKVVQRVDTKDIQCADTKDAHCADTKDAHCAETKDAHCVETKDAQRIETADVHHAKTEGMKRHYQLKQESV